MMASPKEVVLEAVQALPDDATFEDIEYHLYVRARIEEGLDAADRGQVIAHDEVKRRMAEWRQRAR
jgi:predicted transcriptional regulator